MKKSTTVRRNTSENKEVLQLLFAEYGSLVLFFFRNSVSFIDLLQFRQHEITRRNEKKKIFFYNFRQMILS